MAYCLTDYENKRKKIQRISTDDRGGFRRGSGGSVESPLTQNFIFMGNFGNIWDTFLYTSLQQGHFTVNVCKIAGGVSICVDPDQTPRSVASDMGLHCLFRHACPTT